MPKLKAQKRKEAEERQEKYNKLSVEERREKLNKKLGKNVGAKRERERLSKQKEKK